MGNLSVVGAQWGDEGKGKIVDLLTPGADIVVRFAGGSNAGHTLVVDGKRIVVHLLPSGVVHRGKVCVLGDGVVVDPAGLLQELSDLDASGLRPEPAGLRLSARAHLVLPYHRELDRRREGVAETLGTTQRGIGPAYEDKMARRGLRVCDLRAPERLRARLAVAVDHVNGQLALLGGPRFTVDELLPQVLEHARQLEPYIEDTGAFLQRAVADGRKILFEGAQGVLLDIDHGTYPFVTSSTTLAGGAIAGAGVAARDLGAVVGVAKAYITRVGKGPFPTELHGDDGARLRKEGGEFGSTTGRPRRCGWLDLPQLRYAARVGGLDWLALTKADVLAGIEQIKVCVAYRWQGKQIETPPVDAEDLADCEPILEDLLPFTGSLREVRDYDALPAGLRALVALIEREVGVRIGLLSLGPQRDQTILRHGFESVK
ncbi:MAG: adenylosuccinate synthase [Proteobacteria bacterium]|nr:adenylosuccinate synthase [Pseudomonadota bacterium]